MLDRIRAARVEPSFSAAFSEQAQERAPRVLWSAVEGYLWRVFASLLASPPFYCCLRKPRVNEATSFSQQTPQYCVCLNEREYAVNYACTPLSRAPVLLCRKSVGILITCPSAGNWRAQEALGQS